MSSSNYVRTGRESFPILYVPFAYRFFGFAGRHMHAWCVHIYGCMRRVSGRQQFLFHGWATVQGAAGSLVASMLASLQVSANRYSISKELASSWFDEKSAKRYYFWPYRIS